jgi:hypothetical protein
MSIEQQDGISQIENENDGSYSFVYPSQDAFQQLEGERFAGVSWYDLPIPAGMTVRVLDQDIIVQTLGLQRLDDLFSKVTYHQENQYELVYPIEGRRAFMGIEKSFQGTHTAHPLEGITQALGSMEGERARFLEASTTILSFGQKKIEPTITFPGQFHSTQGGPLTYLVVKGERAK